MNWKDNLRQGLKEERLALILNDTEMLARARRIIAYSRQQLGEKV